MADDLAIKANAGHQKEWFAVCARAFELVHRATQQQVCQADRGRGQSDLVGQDVASAHWNDTERQAMGRQLRGQGANGAVAACGDNRVDGRRAVLKNGWKLFGCAIELGDVGADMLKSRRYLVDETAAVQARDRIMHEKKAAAHVRVGSN